MVFRGNDIRMMKTVWLKRLGGMAPAGLRAFSAAAILFACSIAAESQPVFPLPSTSKGSHAIMYYRKLGVAFVLRDLRFGGIERVYVFPPVEGSTQAKKRDSVAIGDSEVVPGEGAFAIRLVSAASSIKYVLPNRSVWSGSSLGDVPVFAAFYQGKTRTAYAIVDDGVVSQLVAEGSFRTPEGITERSTNPDIWKEYGEPDVFWYLEGKTCWLGNIALPLAMLIGGVFSGFLLRVYHRYGVVAAYPAALLIPPLLGGVIAAVSAVIGFRIVSGATHLTILYLAVAVTSFVSGFAGIGVYEVLRRWCTSFPRRVAVLMLMVAGTMVAIWMVFLLYPKASATWSVVWLGVFYSFFSLGLLLSATLHNSSEEHLQQENAG